MKKVDMVAAVAANAEITKKAAATAVDEVFNAISEGLVSEGKVTITGFGTFEVKDREARQGRNPQTGEDITIPAHKAVTFKAGRGLKDEVNA